MLTPHIIVVLYHSTDAIDTLWHCLRTQTHTAWRLTLVDNDPAGGAGDAMVAFGDSRVRLLVNGSNLGFAKAVNQGLRAAACDGAERLLLLNPDVSFGPSFLEQLMQRWTDLGAEVIAPRVMLEDNPTHAWYAGGSLDYGWIFSNRHDLYDLSDPGDRIVDFASGCCLGFTSSVLNMVGLLDERFFVYWEDTDFCLRLKAAGIPIQYVGKPFLLHQGGASSGGERSPVATRLYYRSYAQLLRKHFGMAVALRSVTRVIVKECGRTGVAQGHGRRVAAALVLGLLTRLRPNSLPP